MFRELFVKGGPIVWVLFGLSILAGAIVIAKVVILVGYRRRLGAGDAATGSSAAEVERAVAFEALRLSRGLTTLRIVGTAAPLLGLLGTVLGLYEAFEVVASRGLGDPAAFADGIALALTTTIAGLLVALPALAAHQYLTAAIERSLLELEGALADAAPRRPLRSASR
ncbi:MAG: MotA/TolQ/ExbB proton channel family protein [Candidatus Binatia bacterium]